MNTNHETILIVGSGGREHASALKISKHPKTKRRVLMAPGNGGWPQDLRRAVKAEDVEGIVALAKSEAVDLVVVGPEVPLSLGLVDALEAEGIKAFGPKTEPARLESEKHFMKLASRACNIRTPEYELAKSYAEAEEIIRRTGWTVVKADGLCGGKGVEPADTQEDAIEFARKLLNERIHGPAGDLVLIEKKYKGQEVSLMFLCDGTDAISLPVAQDHKRRFNGDKGPNTGGMGSVSGPAKTKALSEKVLKTIVLPILSYMKLRGTPFRGCLYVGLMIVREADKEYLYVLEFNVRFGDPEIGPALLRLSRKTDLLPYLFATLEPGGLTKLPALEITGNTVVSVALVMKGYPGDYPKGIPITDRGRDTPLAFLYHAGTERTESGGLVSAGGRVMYAIGIGPNRDYAKSRAYKRLKEVRCEGTDFRSDIGAVDFTGNV